MNSKYILTCQNKRFIYYFIPKSGCTSLAVWTLEQCGYRQEDILKSYDADNPVTKLARNLIGVDIVNPNNNYFKFTFVRNPLDRVVSVFLEKVIKDRGETARTIESRLSLNNPTFIDFVTSLENINIEEFDEHLAPQSSLIKGFDLDFVGKLENFEEDFRWLQEKINVSSWPLRLNKTKIDKNKNGDYSLVSKMELSKMDGYPPYSCFYTKDIKSKLNRIYQSDIDKFGY